jgi:hypothetical protein
METKPAHIIFKEDMMARNNRLRTLNTDLSTEGDERDAYDGSS